MLIVSVVTAQTQGMYGALSIDYFIVIIDIYLTCMEGMSALKKVFCQGKVFRTGDVELFIFFSKKLYIFVLLTSRKKEKKKHWIGSDLYIIAVTTGFSTAVLLFLHISVCSPSRTHQLPLRNGW